MGAGAASRDGAPVGSMTAVREAAEKKDIEGRKKILNNKKIYIFFFRRRSLCIVAIKKKAKN